MSRAVENFNRSVTRARKAIEGHVIPPRSLEVVESQQIGSLTKGMQQIREVLIGARVVEIRTNTQTVLGEGEDARILDHQRQERLSDGVHSVIESWYTTPKTPRSLVTATGQTLDENTEWTGCGCRNKNCTHRQQFRERMASYGIDWKG